MYKDLMTNNIRRISHALLVMSLCLGVSGCYGPLKPCFYVDSVQFKVDPEANYNSATEVDLVVAYDESLMKELLNMKAEDYFAKALQLQRDYPDQLAVFHWEVVPGQYVLAEDLNYPKSCPLGGVVFARYLAPGEHRIRIGKEHNIEVHLKESSFCVRPVEGSGFFF